MKDLLIVGAGGFLGTMLRYGIGLVYLRFFETKWYFGTITVNLVGSLLIGILFALWAKQQNQLSLFLVAGFCGGFTTFSTFSLDGLKLLRQSLYLEFFTYASISMVGGLLLCFLGFYLFNKG